MDVYGEEKKNEVLFQDRNQVLSYGNSQDAPLLTNALRKCDVYTQWNFIQPQRRMKFIRR
jgi:hypothetical protein